MSTTATLSEPLIGSKVAEQQVPVNGPKSQLSTLISSLFLSDQRVEAGRGDGKIIGITAPIRGEGSTTIAGLMAKELARVDRSQTLLVASTELERLRGDHLNRFDDLWERNPATGYWQASSALRESSDTRSGWTTDLAFRRSVLGRLRGTFHNVLIDCRSVREGNDISAIGSMIDGFILVVRSGGSTREEVREAIRAVQLTSGVVKGCCFNRRTYPIPQKIYKWFAR